jgi:hypothetical protein
MGTLKRYGYFWVTLMLFLGSLGGHWTCAWFAFVNEQADHGKTPEVSDYIVKTGSETLENWQSEFMQLIWQVAGLAFLLHVGSPQSKEGDNRKERIDELLKLMDPDKAMAIIRRFKKYPRK